MPRETPYDRASGELSGNFDGSRSPVRLLRHHFEVEALLRPRRTSTICLPAELRAISEGSAVLLKPLPEPQLGRLPGPERRGDIALVPAHALRERGGVGYGLGGATRLGYSRADRSSLSVYPAS